MQFFEGEPKSQPEITTLPTPNEQSNPVQMDHSSSSQNPNVATALSEGTDTADIAKTSPTKDDHTLVNIPTARQAHKFAPSQSNHSSQRASLTILDTLFPVIAPDRSRLMEPDTLLHPIQATMESSIDPPLQVRDDINAFHKPVPS